MEIIVKRELAHNLSIPIIVVKMNSQQLAPSVETLCQSKMSNESNESSPLTSSETPHEKYGGNDHTTLA